MRCKHGLTEDTCSFCLGYGPSEIPQTGTPAWALGWAKDQDFNENEIENIRQTKKLIDDPEL